MFETAPSQQARQSKHFPPCFELGQEKSFPVEAPEVVKPHRAATPTGAGPSNIIPDKRTVRFSGNGPNFLMHFATIEYSRVGSQNLMFGNMFATSQILRRWATSCRSPLSCQRKNPLFSFFVDQFNHEIHPVRVPQFLVAVFQCVLNIVENVSPF